MSAFRIEGPGFRPASGAAGEKRTEKKTAPESAVPIKGGFDTASFQPDRLAVMPRMSGIGSRSAEQAQGAAVESLLRENAAALDAYFARGYGFEE